MATKQQKGVDYAQWITNHLSMTFVGHGWNDVGKSKAAENEGETRENKTKLALLTIQRKNICTDYKFPVALRWIVEHYGGVTWCTELT